MLLPKPYEDQRRSPRYAVKRLAKIELSGSDPWRYCLVTNMSEGGVRLHTPGFAVTDEFVLTVSSEYPGKNGIYRVVWRHGSDVGAKFLAPTAAEA
jgi:hypothetical protein